MRKKRKQNQALTQTSWLEDLFLNEHIQQGKPLNSPLPEAPGSRGSYMGPEASKRKFSAFSQRLSCPFGAQSRCRRVTVLTSAAALLTQMQTVSPRARPLAPPLYLPPFHLVAPQLLRRPPLITGDRGPQPYSSLATVLKEKALKVGKKRCLKAGRDLSVTTCFKCVL